MLSIANSENFAIEPPPPPSRWCVYVSWNAAHKSLSESQCVWSKRFQSLTIIFSMRSNFNSTLSIENTTLKSHRFTKELLFWLRKKPVSLQQSQIVWYRNTFDWILKSIFQLVLTNTTESVWYFKRERKSKKRAGKRVGGWPRVLCLMLHIKNILWDI